MEDDFDIPRKDAKIQRTVLIKEHPDYPEIYRKAQFHYDAYMGAGGFDPDRTPWTSDDLPTTEDLFQAFFHQTPAFDNTYLEPMLREGARFIRRLKRAHYENKIKPGIRKLVGFLTKKPPRREGWPDATQQWMDRVTARGLSWDKWSATELVPWLLVYGQLVTVLRRPRTGAWNRAQQEELLGGKDQLYIDIVHPQNVLDWSLDVDENYRWLKYRQKLDTATNPLAERFSYTIRYTWITQKGWWYVDDLYEGDISITDKQGGPVVADSAPWDQKLSGPPVISWQLGELGESLIRDAASAARTQFNVVSQLQNLLVESCFPMLAMPEDAPAIEDAGGPKTITVGQNNVITAPSTSWQPNWISPDSGAFQVQSGEAVRLAEQIEAALGLGHRNTGTSGVAKAFDVMDLMRMLVTLVHDIGEGEMATLTRATEMLGQQRPEKAVVQWPSEFDVVDTTTLLADLDVFLGMKPGTTYTAETIKKAGHALHPDMAKDVREKADAEVDEEAQGRGQDEVPEGFEEKEEGEEEVEAPPGAEQPKKPIEQPEARSR